MTFFIYLGYSYFETVAVDFVSIWNWPSTVTSTAPLKMVFIICTSWKSWFSVVY